MRKVAMTALVSACALLSFAGSASAYEIVGTWMGITPAAGGGRAATTFRFFPNGAFQYQMMTAGPQGSGGYVCQGYYQFDGQNLQTQASGCSSNFGGVPEAMWPNWGGPTQFSDPYTFRWGDTTFRRQQ